MPDNNTLLKYIDQLTSLFAEEFGELNAEQLNFKPSENTWSIGQNVRHLIIINESYIPILDQLKQGTLTLPFIAKIPFVVRYIGRTILKSVDPDRRKKMGTFPLWEPSSSEVEPDIIPSFTKHQEILKEKYLECKPEIDAGVVIHSPVNKNIVYSLGMAFKIMVTHEERHLQQAREVKNLLAD